MSRKNIMLHGNLNLHTPIKTVSGLCEGQQTNKQNLLSQKVQPMENGQCRLRFKLKIDNALREITKISFLNCALT